MQMSIWAKTKRITSQLTNLWETINSWHFKPLSLGIACYTTICNRYKFPRRQVLCFPPSSCRILLTEAISPINIEYQLPNWGKKKSVKQASIQMLVPPANQNHFYSSYWIWLEIPYLWGTPQRTTWNQNIFLERRDYMGRKKEKGAELS